MNVAIKHNGTTITTRTINYQREHRICTGIGTLEITLEGTYSSAISPHDSIDIYENGSFQVRYYVSDVSKNVPDGTIVIKAQDKSKYLVDYFIPQSYTIDYPTYTRYWIEKFLDEAQVSYSFTTSSQGNLISNNTSLGLQPAYDQIMMLLQLSGWYMYFDGNGVAVIGTLDTDLASSAGSIGLRDILDIKRISDDKMLRNRAVVWGQYDPFRQEYAYADVSKHTPWNYDNRDLRAMVISNNNIPNKSSAYGIANQLLKEFSRITVEKHITVWGARNWDLGKALRVNSHIWRGKGLITTFGVSMDRNGLVTNIVLDERCPRLFGFFNFGDYVYVGTFGDGVWRKHIKFDPAWYDFSTGLTNLNITDLHINSGIFGSVGHSGEMFYANDESGSWDKITISSFDSSIEDTVPSGELVQYQPYSGLMARAVIIDKEVNTVKFGIDTWSGLNTGDYFLSYSGIISNSGIIPSGNRGWIVEYDPYTGELVGGLGSGIYPIVYSGNYNFTVLDLENDGRNDYVSVATTTSGLPNIGGFYDFGFQNTQPFASTKDQSNYSVMPASDDYVNINDINAHKTLNVFNKNSLISIDNTVAGLSKVLAFGKDRIARLVTFTKTFNELTQEYFIDVTELDSPTCTNILSSYEILAIYPEWFYNTFTVYYHDNNTNSTGLTFKSIVWDANTNTWGSPTTLGTQNLNIGGANPSAYLTNSITINNIIYNLRYVTKKGTQGGGFFTSSSRLVVILDVIGIKYGTFEERYLLTQDTEEFEAGHYEYFVSSPNTPEDGGTFGRQIFNIFQNRETGVKILGWINYGHSTGSARYREEILAGNDSVLQSTLIYDGGTFRFLSSTSNFGSQLGLNSCLIGRTNTSGLDGFTYNGNIFRTYTSSSSTKPYYEDPSKIYPVLGNDQRYIATDSTDYYICDPLNIGTTQVITIDSNWSLGTPYSSPLRIFGDEVYFTAFNLTDFVNDLIPYRPTTNTFDLTRRIRSSNILSGISRRINYGDFFIAEPGDYSIATPLADILYLDMGTPEFGGFAYLILQREASNFNLIQEAAKPLRIDISNTSPVLSVQDFENTFVSNYVYGTSLEQVIPISGLIAREVRDYRYTLLETQSGIIVQSGGAETQILYVTGSGIYYSNAETYSGGFTIFDEVPSGLAERIETTNFVYPGQFIFVTTSGDNPMFYQRDNDSFFFDSYSGLPDSRATIIRCDDRL